MTKTKEANYREAVSIPFLRLFFAADHILSFTRIDEVKFFLLASPKKPQFISDEKKKIIFDRRKKKMFIFFS